MGKVWFASAHCYCVTEKDLSKFGNHFMWTYLPPDASDYWARLQINKTTRGIWQILLGDRNNWKQRNERCTDAWVSPYWIPWKILDGSLRDSEESANPSRASFFSVASYVFLLWWINFTSQWSCCVIVKWIISRNVFQRSLTDFAGVVFSPHDIRLFYPTNAH